MYQSFFLNIVLPIARGSIYIVIWGILEHFAFRCPSRTGYRRWNRGRLFPRGNLIAFQHAVWRNPQISMQSRSNLLRAPLINDESKDDGDEINAVPHLRGAPQYVERKRMQINFHEVIFSPSSQNYASNGKPHTKRLRITERVRPTSVLSIFYLTLLRKQFIGRSVSLLLKVLLSLKEKHSLLQVLTMKEL